jgi:DNA-binding MarR family transcriptional regulator/GNAT superfamily N-acetyltransferase
MPVAVDERNIAAMRRFSRFYTRQVGLLQDGILRTRFSLTEARVLYELAHRNKPTASAIATELGLDHGYLSRILSDFEKAGLVARTRSADDGRQFLLSLTAKGRMAFAPIDQGSQEQVRGILEKLVPADQQRVVGAMGMIEQLIEGAPADKPAYALRTHRPGDMGWVVERHGVLYGNEYGWDARIEALTAEIVGNFLKNFDGKRERCWIAEIDGAPVGSVFLVRDSDEVARLRLLIVDPGARGLGIGKRLVDECISFARKAGYKKITLWTHGVLVAARAIYQRAGFQLTEQWVHDEFGKPEASETWELTL